LNKLVKGKDVKVPVKEVVEEIPISMRADLGPMTLSWKSERETNIEHNGKVIAVTDTVGEKILYKWLREKLLRVGAIEK